MLGGIKQVTCYCGAYHFPHRIGGGKCTGTNWVWSYLHLVKDECQYCNHLNTGESGCRGDRANTCDVAEQLEPFKECPGYQDHLENQPPLRLPKTEGEYFNYLYGED